MTATPLQSDEALRLQRSCGLRMRGLCLLAGGGIGLRNGY
jgi:hypothetical protein